MRSYVTRKRIIATLVSIIILMAVFLAGAQRGYDLGYTEGEKRANGWWIDKKSRYYESAEVRKKRTALKLDRI